MLLTMLFSMLSVRSQWKTDKCYPLTFTYNSSRKIISISRNVENQKVPDDPTVIENRVNPSDI